MKKKTSKRRQVLGSVGSTMVLVVLVTLAIAIIVNRDTLSIDSITRALRYRDLGTAEQAETFLFSDHSTNTFARLGDGIAVASASGVSYYDKTGESAYTSIFSMGRPMISDGGGRVLAYDLGGTALCIADETGVLFDLQRERTILDARLNKNGWLTVCTDEIGTKGRVTVINTAGEEVYTVASREGYLMGAALAADNQTLVLLTLTEAGGKVLWYNTGSEEQAAAYLAEETLFLDLWCTSSSGAVVLLASDRVVYVDAGGQETDMYSLAGSYLQAYAVEESQVALVVSESKNGGEGTLIRLTGNGEAETVEAVGDVLDMAVSGRYIALISREGLSLYRGMELYAVWEETDGMGRVLLGESGTVIRLSSSRAQLVIP